MLTHGKKGREGKEKNSAEPEISVYDVRRTYNKKAYEFGGSFDMFSTTLLLLPIFCLEKISLEKIMKKRED